MEEVKENSVSEISEEEAPVIEEAEDIDDFDSEEKKEEDTAETDVPEETEEVSEETSEIVQQENVKRKIPWKTVSIAAGVLAAAAAVVYLGGAIYYKDRFFKGTKLGNFDCSGLTVGEAETKIRSEIENFSFSIRERGGRTEYINGDEIAFVCSSLGGVREAKERQNSFAWLTDRDNRELPIQAEISYDEDALYGAAEKLQCTVDSVEGMDGATAGVYYADGAFRMRENEEKNIINFELFYTKLRAGIYGMYRDMSLEEEELYIPMAEEKHMKAALEEMNRYVGASITYTKGDESFVVNGDVISRWVSVAPDYTVTLHEDMLLDYVYDLAGSCNTYGKNRTFTTSYGDTVTIGGGDYGWVVDTAKEAKTLAENVRNGEILTREPIYKQTAQIQSAATDIANTYVEINLPTQHLWYYKNGELISSTDFVSGNPNAGNATPTGVYKLKYKERNATLKGEDYETPVSYWMPFNWGIGMHDASWRSSFGGRIYMGGGSHGCINLPVSEAKKIYENIEAGVPVIVY